MVVIIFVYVDDVDVFNSNSNQDCSFPPPLKFDNNYSL
jgi:hypothetical protein